MSDKNDKAIRAMREFLEAVGVDVEARGMEKTPERVAQMYQYLFRGIGKDTSTIWGETFDSGSDGIIAVRHIPFYSMCEHHLVPFFGEVSIVYLPENGRVAGFSKFSRLVDILSHQPQLQERLTAQIAAAIAHDLGSRGVLVVAEAEQLCMTMRGDLAHGTRTVTSECTGVFRTDSALYHQAWMILGGEKS
ncbi:GTP cyclohydrolase I [Selenomonas sp. GACV-9]|uniref:GTP cyclohydrolase I n=1 Tax=Selenomonas sp. GACV-9 TaxID=3158782 RepID=UPI0008E2CDC2|nr:GTP cyclohydrolase I [Selenomonas ruminantium]